MKSKNGLLRGKQRSLLLLTRASISLRERLGATDDGTGKAIRAFTSLEVRAIKAVIPPRSTRKVKRDCDFALYAERNLVERFFNTIKHYRGIATRYEKTARNFLAGLHLVCALAWLK
jgi:transposase